jgi:ankyrin repeat protein
MQWSRGVWAFIIVCLGVIGLYLVRFRSAKRTFPLIEAVKRGDVQEARILLAQGAAPNTRETQVVHWKWFLPFIVNIPETMAKTALMLAASTGNKDIVQLLLDSGAEVNAKDAWGSGALLRAVGEKGSAEIVQLLIDRGQM